MSWHKAWAMLRAAGMWAASEAGAEEDVMRLNSSKMATRQRSSATRIAGRYRMLPRWRRTAQVMRRPFTCYLRGILRCWGRFPENRAWLHRLFMTAGMVDWYICKHLHFTSYLFSPCLTSVQGWGQPCLCWRGAIFVSPGLPASVSGFAGSWRAGFRWCCSL